MSSARSLALVLLMAFGAGRANAAPEAPAREDAVIVFAASSLREAFTAIAEDFRRAHPGVTVRFNFAGSQDLRTQLEHGAVADVIACADTQTMDELVRAKLASDPVVFAHGTPVVVVAREAASSIRSFADLPNAARIVVAAPEVPIGRYTERILARAEIKLGPGFRKRVLARVASRELNVKQVLAKVKLGEADAGVVYASDARAASDLGVIPIPDDVVVVADFSLAQSTGPAHPALARAFVALVRSEAGRGELSHAGFALPAAGPR